MAHQSRKTWPLSLPKKEMPYADGGGGILLAKKTAPVIKQKISSRVGNIQRNIFFAGDFLGQPFKEVVV